MSDHASNESRGHLENWNEFADLCTVVLDWQKHMADVPFLKKAPNASFAVIFDIAACSVEHDGTPSW